MFTYQNHYLGTLTDLSITSGEHGDKISTLEIEFHNFKDEQVCIITIIRAYPFDLLFSRAFYFTIASQTRDYIGFKISLISNSEKVGRKLNNFLPEVHSIRSLGFIDYVWKIPKWSIMILPVLWLYYLVRFHYNFMLQIKLHINYRIRLDGNISILFYVSSMDVPG